MPFDLSSFGLAEMLRCGRTLRDATADATTVQEIAEATVRVLRREFIDPTANRPACALVRFYKTHSYGALPPDEQAFARRRLGSAAPGDEMKCLTLLATAGDEPSWNDPRKSHDHRAIPLATVEMVEQAPMIASLLQQFGLDIEALITTPPPMLAELSRKTYNVFHVADAKGSDAIPAQTEFVIPHQIRSVLGFGGLLRTGDLFAVIMFARVPIPDETASRFRNIALDVKTALFSLRDDRVFA